MPIQNKILRLINKILLNGDKSAKLLTFKHMGRHFFFQRYLIGFCNTDRRANILNDIKNP